MSLEFVFYTWTASLHMDQLYFLCIGSNYHIGWPELNQKPDLKTEPGDGGGWWVEGLSQWWRLPNMHGAQGT